MKTENNAFLATEMTASFVKKVFISITDVFVYFCRYFIPQEESGSHGILQL